MGACEVKVQKTKAGWDSFVLTDSRTLARAELHPTRGALISSFDVGAHRVLSLDEATLFDPTKNVRGGIPLLFPIAGKLPADSYEHGGRKYELKQHGFARTSAWNLVGTLEGEEAVVRCGLASSAETLARFPFPFEATYEVSLSQRTLKTIFTVKNTGFQPLPLHYGLHPYFFVQDAFKGSAQVTTDAKTAFDNRTGETGAFGGFKLTSDEVDLHLLDHKQRGTKLDRPPLNPLELGWDKAFKTLVVWTVKGKDYVCVEPWTAPAGALAKNDGLISVAPGEQRALAFWIKLLV